MLCPILCTCGKELNAYYAAFQKAREIKMVEVMKNHPKAVLPSMELISDELQPLMGDILDSLHMRKTCCRQKLLTSVDFHSFY